MIVDISQEEVERFEAEGRLKCRLLNDKNYKVTSSEGDDFIATFYFHFNSPLYAYTNVFVKNEMGNLTDILDLDSIQSCVFIG